MKTLKIIKIGGHIIDDAIALDTFLFGFSKLTGPKILVHGGGKLATKLAEKMNVEVQIINGRRITDADTLDIITMVYAGKINKNIVAKLQVFGCNAIGFSGADGNSIVSVKRPVTDIDFGFVGDIKSVNLPILKLLLNNSVTPVFCAITHDEAGQLLNTNADTIASELAIAFAEHYKTELYYCFEKRGVLTDVDDNDSVVESINPETYKTLKANGIIADGMLPKLDNCFHAVQNNVEKVCVGRSNMLFTNQSKFTTIQK